MRDPVVVHVLVDLHAEELRREELAELAVPRRARVQPRVGAERAGQVLVHADRDAEVVLAEADRVGGERQRARRGRAAVVDVGERDAGEPEQRDDRVGVVDLVAARRTRTGCRATRRRHRPARAGSRSRPCRCRSRPGSGRTGAAPRRRSRRPLPSTPPRADRPERERHDLVAVVVGAERHQHQLHLHARCEHVGIGLGEPRLDLHLAGQLDVPDAERNESPARSGPRTAATAAGSPAWSTPTAGRAGRAGARPSRSTRSAGTSPARET